MSTIQQRKVVDSRGSFCPGPITDLFKAYRNSQVGDVIELWATDPAAKSDVTAWARKSGNSVVEIVEEKDYTKIVVGIVRKGK
ncbi:MAG: sulfurtransferase TusA family protein [Thaumarchaeota archaeon]|nr:sulfurtransferase TusA family protein [Nitrososphaerota archaeon]